MNDLVKSLSTYTTTVIFWLSIFGTIFLGLNRKTRNYVIPGEKKLSSLQAGTLMFTGLYYSSVLYWSFFESIFLNMTRVL